MKSWSLVKASRATPVLHQEASLRAPKFRGTRQGPSSGLGSKFSDASRLDRYQGFVALIFFGLQADRVPAIAPQQDSKTA
ncbi:MAG: hypothetical protein AB4352_15635 [Hormoscilla sp.]